MKKVIFSVIVVLAYNLSNAQVDYGKYAFGNMSIVVDEGKSQGTMYMDIKDVGISLTAEQRSIFISFLDSSYSVYSRWSDVAKENNVNELRKDIESVKLDGYFKYGSKWQFSTANIKTIIVISEGKHTLYIYVPPMISSSNQYMKSEGQIGTVTSEIISEIKLYLEEEKINEFILSKNNVEDLFKK
jgi:hypothetical protein